MAGYWVASDLAQYVVRPNMGSVLITPSSIPVNLQQFQEIIDEVSGQFDQAAHKGGYAIPVSSSASAYVTVRGIVRQGAVADVLRIVYTGPDSKYIDRFQTAFDNALKAIEQGDRPLPGAAADAGGGVVPIWSGIASPVMNATMGFPQDLGIPNDF